MSNDSDSTSPQLYLVKEGCTYGAGVGRTVEMLEEDGDYFLVRDIKSGATWWEPWNHLRALPPGVTI
jgi:hypothetical protein